MHTRAITVVNDTALKLEALQKELTAVYGHHVTYADVVEQLIQNCTRKATSRHWRWEVQKNPTPGKKVEKELTPAERKQIIETNRLLLRKERDLGNVPF